MAGLACGEPNTISWDILKNHVTTFVSADDPITVRGMRMLAAPLKGDAPIVSGESGAVPFGTLATIMLSDECKELRDQLDLNENSQVLRIFNRRRYRSRPLQKYRLAGIRKIKQLKKQTYKRREYHDCKLRQN